MRQVFLMTGLNQATNFENQDALPMSEKLLVELEKRFDATQNIFEFASAEALVILRDFYAQYELSQPQRRVRIRLERFLAENPPDCIAQFIVAEVSEHRSRRSLNENRKKTEQLY